MSSKITDKKRRLRLVDKYENDDFSSYAGPDYAENNEKKDFAGFGPKNYQRTDDRIFEEVCETLMRDPEVDATNIGVKVTSGVVYLSGKVDSRRTKKTAELIIEDLPGVQEVRNELIVIFEDSFKTGPQSVTSKDLGLN